MLTFNIFEVWRYLISSGWMQAFIVFAFLMIVLNSLFDFLIVKWAELLHKVYPETQIQIQKAIEIARWPLYTTFSFFISFASADSIDPTLLYYRNFSSSLLLGVCILYSTFYLQIVLFITLKIWIAGHIPSKKDQETKVAFLNIIVKIITWVASIILILQSLNFNVTALVTGLGVTGVAVALAVQSVLSDVLGAFTIYFDQPFQIGDYIEFTGESGKVESIGLRSSRVRTEKGDILIIPNKVLTTNIIHNYGQAKKRLAEVKIRLSFYNDLNKIKTAKKELEEIIKSANTVELRIVKIDELAENSIILNLVFYVLTNDYQVLSRVRENILIKSIEKLQELGIKIFTSEGRPQEEISLKDKIIKESE
jgi:small-conductance mechanosensitive channel